MWMLYIVSVERKLSDDRKIQTHVFFTIYVHLNSMKLHKIKFVQLDQHLITTLVERWCQKTHIFHIVHEEYTITLQTQQSSSNFPFANNHLLSHLTIIESSCIMIYQKQRQMIVFLRQVVSTCRDQHSNFTILTILYTRASILTLIGELVFPDKSNSQVHLMYLPLLDDLNNIMTYS